MFTCNRSPDAAQITGRPFRTAFLAAIVLATAACGGGGDGAGSLAGPAGGATPQPPTSAPPTSPPTPPAAVGKGSVIVRVTTSSGSPIDGIDVGLNFDGRTKTTDATGEARFNDVPAGDTSAQTGGRGYHWAGRRFAVTGGSLTEVTVTLEHVTEATPVLLATHPVASDDGGTLTVDFDIAVLDERGVARETLTASDFVLYGSCSWDGCIFEADGTNTNLWYDARVSDATFSPLPMSPRPAIAAAVLLDQSADMASFDPIGLRFEAVTSFFESVTPPDAVTLGTYQGVPSTAVLTTYGDFTSDTEGLRTAVNALAGQERGTNPLYTAITDMIAYTATHAPSGSNERQRSVVAVSTEPTVGDDACTHLESCRRAMLAAAEAGRAAGVALVSIGRGYAPPACEIAKRTGGACALVEDPAQLPVVFRALDGILGRSLAFSRVRLVLEAQPGAFVPGRTVGGYLEVRIGPHTTLMWWVSIPI
jgi:hypothetical protein